MAIALAGTAEFARAIFDDLVQDIDVELIISQPDRPAGRGRKLAPPPVAAWAHAHDLELHQPERIDDEGVLSLLQGRSVDTVVVVAYGQMVREPMLSSLLMLNVHASLLPAWRGAAPIERSIMAGDEETGVCIMRMEAGLDTGPVAAREVVSIGIDDRAGDIYDRCATAGSALLRDVLGGSPTFTEQTEAGASYAEKIVAADRQLDVRNTSAIDIHNRIRALSPHIGGWLEFDGVRSTIWRSRLVTGDSPAPGVVVATDESTLIVGCSDGAVELLEVQPAGKRAMNIADWLRGLPQAPSSV